MKVFFTSIPSPSNPQWDGSSASVILLTLFFFFFEELCYKEILDFRAKKEEETMQTG